MRRPERDFFSIVNMSALIWTGLLAKPERPLLAVKRWSAGDFFGGIWTGNFLLGNTRRATRANDPKRYFPNRDT